MKFGKKFEQTLAEDEIPEDWIEAAIQYKALKKCIGNIVDELQVLGLEQNTLRLLLDKIEVDESETTASNPVIAQYVLSKTKDNHIVPALKITIDYSNDLTDDHINSSIELLRKNLEQIANFDTISQMNEASSTTSNGSSRKSETSEKIVELNDNLEEIEQVLSKASIKRLPGPGRKFELSIKLNADAKFFQMLETELNNLDRFRTQEENKMIKDIEEVSDVLTTLTTKESTKKSDIYTWRELFKLFLDNEIYFKYNETSLTSSENSFERTKENLEEFNKEIYKAGLLNNFKNKKSLRAFSRFLEINDYLLKVLEFQSMNSTAFRKILKKFDKQTSLNIKSKFPKLVSQDHVFFTGKSISQSICYIIQSSLLQLIPQLDDYTCPICLEIAFKPIKLDCGHLFCVRCLVKLKQQDNYNCPICRSDKVLEIADSSNLDYETMSMMKRLFPKEVKKKLKEREEEQYTEIMGKDPKCVIV